MIGTPNKLMTPAEVAYVLGRDVQWFYRHKKRLIRERRFPAPVLGFDYDPLAIMAWRLAQMDPALRAVLEAAALTAPAPVAVADVVRVQEIDWDAELDRRARDLGARPSVAVKAPNAAQGHAAE